MLTDTSLTKQPYAEGGHRECMIVDIHIFPHLATMHCMSDVVDMTS